MPRALAAAIALDPMLMDEAIVSVLVHGNEEFRNIVQSFRLRRPRSLHISNNQFNLNAWDQQSSLEIFDFFRQRLAARSFRSLIFLGRTLFAIDIMLILCLQHVSFLEGLRPRLDGWISKSFSGTLHNSENVFGK
jgi:hypothetical protein